jgi:RNA polymerase sigma-70 factor, ECF subfamily
MTMGAERAEAGGEREETRLWVTYGGLVGRVCRALLDGEAAGVRAAVENTFTRAFSRDVPVDGVKGWLCGIARAECARVAEAGGGIARAETAHADESEAFDGAATRGDARPERARALLADLKPTERDAVVLWRVGGLSLAETARACGVDEASARARVNRALSRLRRACADE